MDLNAIAFLFDGRRLRAEQTPDEVFSPFPLHVSWLLYNPNQMFNVWIYSLQLEMEDGDEIDAMLHQTGGSAA